MIRIIRARDGVPERIVQHDVQRRQLLGVEDVRDRKLRERGGDGDE